MFLILILFCWSLLFNGCDWFNTDTTTTLDKIHQPSTKHDKSSNNKNDHHDNINQILTRNNKLRKGNNTSYNTWLCIAPMDKVFADKPIEHPFNLKNVIHRMRYVAEPRLDDQAQLSNTSLVKRLLPKAKFAQLFPYANLGAGVLDSSMGYSYERFIIAISKWPDFCAPVRGDDMCLLELAVVFAHAVQETGMFSGPVEDHWRQGLYHYRESGCEKEGTCLYDTYCEVEPFNTIYPCFKNARYFGRGAHQLSYNVNYGPFSQTVFNHAKYLLENPDNMFTPENLWTLFGSAIWFYMTPQSPKPSMHDVVTGTWIPSDVDLGEGRTVSFGTTILIINGGVECIDPTRESIESLNRIDFFKKIAEFLNVSTEHFIPDGCRHKSPFNEKSSSAIPSFWGRGFGEGSDCSCSLVSYQSAWSVFYNLNDFNLSYCDCVDYFYGLETCGQPRENKCRSDLCESCVAMPSSPEAITDEQCSHCPHQSWWPCNTPGLCQCP